MVQGDKNPSSSLLAQQPSSAYSTSSSRVFILSARSCRDNELSQQWANWVKMRYETNEALTAAWGSGVLASDSVDAEELQIYGAWEMYATGPSNPAERARMGDFTRFLSDMQREYWIRRRDEIRSTGYKGVVLSTGWKAGKEGGDASNLYADSALETIDRHGYWGGFGDTHIALTGLQI